VDPPASFAKVKSFTVTTLLRPADWGEGSLYAAAVSDKGQVIGTYSSVEGLKGWSWQKGEFTDLGGFWPKDINNKGQMIGYSWPAGQVLRDNGVMTPLPGPAVAINNLGHVVGTLTENGHPYLWRDGITTDLGSMRPVPPYMMEFSQVVDINDNDQIVAVAGFGAYYDPFRGYFWENGRWTALGTAALDDHGTSQPTGINKDGQVVGVATSASDSDLPFLWHDGVMTTIGSFPGFHSAEAVDDNGVVAGGCVEMSGSTQRSFPCLYYDGELTELQSAASSFTFLVDMSPNGKFIAGMSSPQGSPIQYPVLWVR
jgi:probable HAF family extracellular repeat protein